MKTIRIITLILAVCGILLGSYYVHANANRVIAPIQSNLNH